MSYHVRNDSPIKWLVLDSEELTVKISDMFFGNLEYFVNKNGFTFPEHLNGTSNWFVVTIPQSTSNALFTMTSDFHNKKAKFKLNLEGK